MKIPNEDLTDETLAIDDTFEGMSEVVMGVVYMEVDKVANEVANMVVNLRLTRWPTCWSRYLTKTSDVTGNW